MLLTNVANNITGVRAMLLAVGLKLAQITLKGFITAA
jgi:hypothetical protein